MTSASRKQFSKNAKKQFQLASVVWWQATTSKRMYDEIFTSWISLFVLSAAAPSLLFILHAGTHLDMPQVVLSVPPVTSCPHQLIPLLPYLSLWTLRTLNHSSPGWSRSFQVLPLEKKWVSHRYKLLLIHPSVLRVQLVQEIQQWSRGDPNSCEPVVPTSSEDPTFLLLQQPNLLLLDVDGGGRGVLQCLQDVSHVQRASYAASASSVFSSFNNIYPVSSRRLQLHGH